jgi:hypothetical protein
MTNVDPGRTRDALVGAEALFGAGVICTEALTAVQDLGVPVDLAGINFVTRTAPMGPVSANVAVAVFFNFNPAVVERAIPSAWQAASPPDILAAYSKGFDTPLEAALSTLEPGDLAEYAALSRTAAGAACQHTEGRALFAAFAGLSWPDADHLVAWHAGKLLREHRGDGHVAALVVEGLSGIEALVVHEAFDPAIPTGVLRRSRSWPRDQWAAAVDGLRTRGWLTDAEEPTLTEWGRARRQAIEDRTSELAAVAYEPIGPDGIERLVVLGTAIAAALRTAGLSLETFFARMAEGATR